jgi:hypothetical protein
MVPFLITQTHTHTHTHTQHHHTRTNATLVLSSSHGDAARQLEACLVNPTSLRQRPSHTQGKMSFLDHMGRHLVCHLTVRVCTSLHESLLTWPIATVGVDGQGGC